MRVVVHFKGGLGNQLIQYAFVRKYFAHPDVEIVFDATHFRLIRERQFFLGNFPHTPISSIRKVFLLLGMYYRIAVNKLRQAPLLAFVRSGMGNYIDDSFDFTDIDSMKHKTVYVNGYFQHLELFPFPSGNPFYTFLETLSDSLQTNPTFQLIRQSQNPVMLHLRRGDYVQNETVKKNMGTCGLTYFQKGIEVVTHGLQDYTLFVFSDDTAYAADLFKGMKSLHVVIGDTANPVQDFLLMRCFQYAIISNSTLSYMANMFSSHEENLVVIPRPWFENGLQFRLGVKENWCYVDKT